MNISTTCHKLCRCAGVHCNEAGTADSTAENGIALDKATGTVSSYGVFSDSERRLLEETGTKQEFQAEVCFKFVMLSFFF